MSDNQPLILTYGADAKALDDAMNRSLTKVIATMDKMEARVTAFERKIAGMGKTFSGGKVVNEINTIEQALARVGNTNAGKALANVFDRSRLAVLETGATKIPLFGSALADLGTAGVAAAVGIGAAALAIDRAIKFTEKSAEIERTAEKLKLTTTQVQELGHVFTELNVPVDEGIAAISELRGQITEYETNISKFGAKTFGGLLKISPEDLKNAGDFNAQLKLILDKYSKLSGDAQLAFAKKTGVDPEVLNSLAKAKDRYADLVSEAHRYGLVIDADVVKRGAEANAKLKTAGEIISTNLTVAFADLTPVILGVANAIVEATRRLNEFIQSFKSLDTRNEGALRAEQAELIAQDAAIRRTFPGIKAAPQRGQSQQYSKAGLDSFFMDPSDRLTAIRNDLSDVDLALVNQQKADAAQPDTGTTPTVPGKTRGHADHAGTELAEAQIRYLQALERGTKDLDEAHRVKLSLALAQYQLALANAAHEKKADVRQKLVDTADKTYAADVDDENLRYAQAQADHSRAFTDELDKLQQGQLEAQAGITGQLADRQAAERARLRSEQAQAAADTAAKVAKLAEEDKVHGQAMGAQLISAQAAEFLAQDDEQRARQARESADQAADNELRSLGFDKQRLEALEKLATTQAARRALAEQVLKNEQRQAELQLDKQHLGPQDDAAARRALGLDFQARGADLNRQFEGPIAQFADKNSLANLGTDLQTHAVDAVDTLNKGLAEAIANGKSATDILKNLPRQFLAGLVQKGLGDVEGSLLSKLGFGSGGGGGGGAAGLSLGGGNFAASAAGGGGGGIGSLFNIGFGLLKFLGFDSGGTVPGHGRGDKVPAMLEPGERVIRNGPSQRFAPFLDAMNAGAPIPGFAAGGIVGSIPSGATGRRPTSVTLNSHYDMRGVQGDRQIMAMIEAGGRATEARLVAALPSLVPNYMAEFNVQSGR